LGVTLGEVPLDVMFQLYEPEIIAADQPDGMLVLVKVSFSKYVWENETLIVRKNTRATKSKPLIGLFSLDLRLGLGRDIFIKTPFYSEYINC